MQVLYQRCAGIDVHLRFLVVCLSIVEAGQRRKEVRSFRNETADLLALRAWLLQEGCTHVGMESTGVYWLQVYRRLEGFARTGRGQLRSISKQFQVARRMCRTQNGLQIYCSMGS